MSTFDEDEVARLNRRLLVVEQLMHVAGADRDGHPFAVADAAEFFIGVAELISDVRQTLPHVTVEVPARVAPFTPR